MLNSDNHAAPSTKTSLSNLWFNFTFSKPVQNIGWLILKVVWLASHERRDSSLVNAFSSKKQALKVILELSPLFRCYLTKKYCFIASMRTLDCK